MNFFKKMSTIALGATMVLGLGLSLGLNNNVAVKAAEGDHAVSLQVVGPGTGAGWTNTINTAYQMVEQADGSFEWTGAFTVERFRLITGGTWNTSLDWTKIVSTSEKVFDGTFVKASTVEGITDGDNNIWCTIAGSYTLKVNAGKTELSIVSSSVAKVTVTEYAVVDGTKEDTAYGSEYAYEDTAFVPTDAVKTGYYHAGWYTDEACTTKYVSAILTVDTTLYAKYTTPTDAKVVYYSHTGWENCYVYVYGGQEQFGAWPGEKISVDASMTDGAKFNGVGALYKVTYYAEYEDTKIVFTDNSGAYVHGTNQTNDLAITANACYFIGDAVDSTGDLDKGAAAKVVFDINAARKAVVAADPILAKSYCGVSAATATTLIGEYDALTETQKGYVDASTDYTYNHEDPTGDNVDVSFTAIIAQLKLIAGTSSTVTAPNTTSNTNVTLIVCSVLVCVLGLTAAGVILVLKRKKETF